MKAIEVKKLKKSFKGRIALDEISFSVDSGSIYGLVGPDGSGKTTLIRIMTGILSSDSGEVSVGGYNVIKNPEDVKHIIGYMSQRFSLYGDLSVIENLNFYADLYEVYGEERKRRIEKLLQFSRLGPFLDRRADALSGGMKQKLGLSCALIHTPKILFLDEPTTGVDPVSRRELWMILYELWKEGMTIFVTTPYMDEAERCGKVGFINRGVIIQEGSPEEIKSRTSFSVLKTRIENMQFEKSKLHELKELPLYNIFGEYLHFIIEDEKKDIGQIKNEFKKTGIKISDLIQVEPNLEDIFLYRTRHLTTES